MEEKIIRILKRIFVCLPLGHKWEVEAGQDMFVGGVPWFRCERCGKRENVV